MCIISNKQKDVLEKILIYYGLIIKCPNAFRYQKGLTSLLSNTKKTVKMVVQEMVFDFSLLPKKCSRTIYFLVV